MKIDEARGVVTALGLPIASPEAWALLDRRSSVRSYPSASVLWTGGSEASHLLVVLTGRVRIVRARWGRQHLVHVASPGDLIGDVPTFDGGPYPATAITAQETACLAVPGDVVTALVEQGGPIARFFVERLASRVRALVDRLERQTLGDVRSRLAASLVGLAVEQDSSTVRLPSPRSEWAEDLGTVRETLAREVSRLVREGLVARAGSGRLTIVDELGLERAALEPGSRS